ncbi:MAG TPA: Crp/Fnr family transcriptional regulator, partial [Methylocella sp.]|nr:Crp/Fnr family transcriptional regulator [Methylocella sp.]
MTKGLATIVGGNWLLESLDEPSAARVHLYAEKIDVGAGDIVCWAGEATDHAYFPDSAILSALTILTDGASIETARIGREGAFGLFEAMYTHSIFGQCVCTVPGTILRVPFKILRFVFEHSPRARGVFIAYRLGLGNQIEQAVACYASHNTLERVSRWLLAMDDRMKGKNLPFTHEFLAHLLGANRKSVTLALQAMQASNCIIYHRGKIKILDRPRLEKMSCECYKIMKAWTALNAPPPPP